MPTNTESLNRELFRLLSKYKPKPLDAEGKATPVPEEADIFKFEFTKDGKDYGTVYVTLDEDRVLTVYFGDDVADSPDEKTPGLDYDDTFWDGLLHQLSSWRMTKGLRGFKTQNKDRVGDDMARRNHMRNKDKIAEGYYPMGKSRSYSDAVPSVKIVIEHSRVIEEGEQRYRNINRIFLENQDGERYLLDTKKPGIARVYARHIAEGGKVNDDRWSHIGNLCEEYQKMAGFVRATRNGQFNESAQSLVNEGIEHYQSLRESLSRMTGKRGYNAYFENWTPSLMEDGTEENNLNELFVQETLDPRIESVMPILNRIHKKVSESIVDKEVNKLAEWADSLVEDESIKSNNPVGIPEDHSLKTEAKYDPTVDGSHSYGTDLLFNIRMLYIYARDGRDTRDQIASLKNLKDGIEQSEEPRLIQCYDFLMKNLAGGTVTDPKMIMQIADKAHQLFHPSLEPIAQATREGVEMEEAITPGASLQRFKNDPRGNQKLPATQKKELDEFDIDTLNQLASHPMAGTLAAAGGAAIGATIGKGITKAADWYKNRQEKKAQDHDMRGNKVAEGYDYSNLAGKTDEELSKLAMERSGGSAREFSNELMYLKSERNKADRAAALNNQGAANENFINQADQAVVSEEDEMAEGILDRIKDMFGKKTPETPIEEPGTPWEGNPKGESIEHEMDEGEHTQHYDAANKFTGDIDHGERPPTDWSVDPIEAGTDRIHDKISKMLKKLSKPNHEPNMKDTDLGSTVLDEVDLGQYDAVKPISNSGTTPEQENEFRKKVQAYGKELDQRQKEKQKEKDNVKEGQEDFDAILRIIRK